MKKILVTALIGLTALTLTACEVEETETSATTRKQTTTTTQPEQTVADEKSFETCIDAIKLDDKILNETGGALANIFDTDRMESAAQYISSVTPERAALKMACEYNLQAGEAKADTLQSCVDVLNIDDVIFVKAGEAFDDIFNTAKMEALTAHVQSVTDERVLKSGACSLLYETSKTES